MYIILSNSDTGYLKNVKEYNINLGACLLKLNNNGKINKNKNIQIDEYANVYNCLIYQIGNIRTLNVYSDFRLPKGVARFNNGNKFIDVNLKDYNTGEDMIKSLLTSVLKSSETSPKIEDTESEIEKRKKAWIERLKNENNK